MAKCNNLRSWVLKGCTQHSATLCCICLIAGSNSNLNLNPNSNSNFDSNAMVTCKIKFISKLFQSLSTSDWNNFISVRGAETCPKLFQTYFRGLLQLVNIFQRVQCRRNDFKIISELFQRLKWFYFKRNHGLSNVDVRLIVAKPSNRNTGQTTLCLKKSSHLQTLRNFVKS